jgi:hypothetical protein
MLLILKIIKKKKKYYQSIVVMWQHMFSMPVICTVWRRALGCNIIVVDWPGLDTSPPYFFEGAEENHWKQSFSSLQLNSSITLLCKLHLLSRKHGV